MIQITTLAELEEFLDEYEFENLNVEGVKNAVSRIIANDRSKRKESSYEFEIENLREQIADMETIIRDYRDVAAEFETLKQEIQRNDSDRFFVGVSIGAISETIDHSQLEEIDV